LPKRVATEWPIIPFYKTSSWCITDKSNQFYHKMSVVDINSIFF
jgi:hypothetical protein